MVWLVLFGFSCIHLRNFCVVDSATHMNVSRSLMECSSSSGMAWHGMVWVCICVGAYINNGNNKRTKASQPTNAHITMTKNAFCGAVAALVLNLSSPLHDYAPFGISVPLVVPGVVAVPGWFIMQKLCKDKQNYEQRQQLASKNSMKPCPISWLHKVFHIMAKRQALTVGGLCSGLPVPS